MRKGLLLYNPAAGRLPVKRFVRSIMRPLRLAGWEVEVAETLSGSHATSVARQAASERFDAVFAIGGDGTLGQVANGLIGTDTALAALPAGTMNVWANEVGERAFDWFHPRALSENAKLLANAPTYCVDAGLCNGHAFLLWSGIGLDAEIIRQLEPRPRVEKYVSVPQYVATTVWNVTTVYHGMDLRVWADDERVEGHYLLAVAINIRKYVGGLAVLSPDAYLDDGQMDLWLVNGSTLADALRAFFEVLAGVHVNSDQVRRLPFHAARVESDTAFAIQMDGEPMLGGKQAELSVQKRALRILVPPTATRLLKEKPCP